MEQVFVVEDANQAPLNRPVDDRNMVDSGFFDNFNGGFKAGIREQDGAAFVNEIERG